MHRIHLEKKNLAQNHGRSRFKPRAVSFLKRAPIPLSMAILLFLMGFLSACSSQKATIELDHYMNSVGMDFVLVPSGSFTMGEATRSQCTTCNAKADETPRHPVVISRSFYISTHEVTQSEFMAIMNDNPSRFKGKNLPVDSVSWSNAKLYIEGLNALEKTQAYRLPTEAEWEYAARAGSETAYCFGDSPGQLTHYAWIVVNSGAKTHGVGKKNPNPWGIYDMYGNVFEWCEDWYLETFYGISPKDDPTGPNYGVSKVKRGGSMDRSARSCRSSSRAWADPQTRSDNTGFRIVKEP
ncbi:MAG: formylglycine-generating enzyme family protein [Proteobacteria bacterium]|nr:formylglycine-generating enzyme family protein [Pseudomonadota bacterium]